MKEFIFHMFEMSLTPCQHLRSPMDVKHLHTMMNVLHLLWRRVQEDSWERKMDTGRKEVMRDEEQKHEKSQEWKPGWAQRFAEE